VIEGFHCDNGSEYIRLSEAEHAIYHVDFVPGDYVLVAISDTVSACRQMCSNVCSSRPFTPGRALAR